MLIIHVRAVIKPESREAFLATARDVIAQTRREPGSLCYSCYEDIAEPNVFIFYEEWRTQADIDAHLAQPYTQTLLAAAAQWVTTPPVMKLHDVANSRPLYPL
jgi:quinol monooxygenase YgiN